MREHGLYGLRVMIAEKGAAMIKGVERQRLAA
jgi:succinate dehydrogenase/fumarate reductase cytochrome b subunit